MLKIFNGKLSGCIGEVTSPPLHRQLCIRVVGSVL